MPPTKRTPQVCPQFASSGTCINGARCKSQHILRILAPNGASVTPQATVQAAAGRRKKSGRGRTSTSAPTKFSAFFANYPGFDYNPGNSSILEFYRLCDFKGWNRQHPDRDAAHRVFKDALVKEFNDIYGTNKDDINSWHKICTILDIDPLPGTLKEARAKVMSKHINLVDLVDNPAGRVHSFPSLAALSEYTISTGKFFPKRSAHAGGLLKYLLRDILGSREGRVDAGRL